MCQEPTELLWIGCLTGLILQIRYIETKHQLADILTEGNFTRDEWNNLLHLFNISHFSSSCCAKISSLISGPNNDCRKGCRNRREKKEVWQNRNLQRWICLLMFRQVLHPQKVPLHPKFGDTQRETWKQDEQKFEIRRSVEISSAAARCTPWRVDGHSNGETCRMKKMWQGNRLLIKQLLGNQMHPVNHTTR